MVTCACSCVTFSYLLRQPGPVCFPGQVNRFWACAFWRISLWKSARRAGCMWGTGREKELGGTHQRFIARCCQTLKKLISRHHYKALGPAEEQWNIDTQAAKGIREVTQGVRSASPLVFQFQKSLPRCFCSKCRSCPWQAGFKCMLMHPRPFK